jgi:DnaJ family protein C protein 28
MSKREDEKDEREEWTEQERQTEHKLRMRFGFRDLIEDMIQDGQERGVFDNLRGTGKPLHLRANLYEGDSQLANSLMKENKLLPVWLQRRNAVHEAIEQLRQTIVMRWQRHEQAYRYAQDDGRRRALALSWDDARRSLEVDIVEINKLIEDFNLRRPSDNMEIFKLRLADELKRAGATHNLGD